MIGAASIAQWLLAPLVSPSLYLFYLPAVVFASLWGSGLTAVLLGTFGTIYFSPPIGLTLDWPDGYIRTSFFLTFGSMIWWLTSARANALKQVKIEKDKLNAIIQNINIGIGITNPNGEMLSLNLAGLKMHGLDSDSEMPSTFSQYSEEFEVQTLAGQAIPTKDWPLSRALRGDFVRNLDLKLIIRSTGISKILSYSASPVRAPNGEIVNLAISFQDITERSRAELEIRKNESTLSAILNATQESIWLFDTDSKILMANAIALKRIGRTAENTIGKSFHELLSPELAASRLLQIKKVIETRKEVQFEDSRSGIEFRHSFTPVYAPDGSVNAVVSFSRDITAQKNKELELKDSAERFRSLANSMPQLVWTATPDGVVDYYNDRIVEYGGAKRLENGRWAWEAISHPEDQERVLQAWRLSVKTQEPYFCESRVQMNNGVYNWHLTRAMPTRAPDGQVIKWIGTSTNIQSLKETQQSLSVMVHARDQFLTIASHELKTPLTSLQLQTQMTKRNLALKGEEFALAPEKMKIFLTRTDRQVQRLSRLIDDMLDISRLGAGKSILNPATMSLNELAREVCEKMRPLAPDNRVKIELSCEGNAVGEWDNFRLEQVFTNLLSNALKYGLNTPVQVRVWENEDQAFFSISDQGRGIAPEDQARIFQRFERAISENEVSGFGVGLYISQEIVKLHGGSIRVESALGKGATFTVRLPKKNPLQKVSL